MKILIINGPNLSMLGKREPNIYGDKSLDEINDLIKNTFKNHKFSFFQSNEEGKIVNEILNCYESYDGIVINPGAYSHYSIAILDALKTINIPTVEVHISNIYKREEYRKKSVTAEGAIGIISGFGYKSYILGVMALEDL